MPRRRRGALETIAVILQSAVEPKIKTELMYDARLAFSGLQRNLNFLVDLGLLENNAGLFKTTGKGLRFLQMYRRVAEMLQED